MDENSDQVVHHGDPLFHQITQDEVEFYDRKNADYAAGGADPNGNFNRVSAFFSRYPGLSLSDPRVVALTYMMKQVDSVLWALSRGYEGKVEGLDARLCDVHIYSKIVRVLNRHMLDPKTSGGKG
jgi:hypothetical protein